MDYIIALFGSKPSLSGIFQIVLDITILILLFVILAGRKPKVSMTDDGVVESFTRIIAETEEISREFGANLEKRQELIRQVIGKLDQRITEAEDLCTRMERLDKEARESAEHLKALSTSVSANVINRSTGKADHQRVLLLAHKGLEAAEIARSLKKPLGEVELILNLQKIST
ncbi:MAG: hypothetical protein ABFD97_21155 [Syntrophobacter sp.]